MTNNNKYNLPALDQFIDASTTDKFSVAQSKQATINVGEFIVELYLRYSSSMRGWAGKGYITSIDGTVLFNVSTNSYDKIENAHTDLIYQVERGLSQMNNSHVTGSFPFVSRF